MIFQKECVPTVPAVMTWGHGAGARLGWRGRERASGSEELFCHDTSLCLRGGQLLWVGVDPSRAQANLLFPLCPPPCAVYGRHLH